MHNLEKEKKRLQKKRLELGIQENEFKILERMKDIRRIEDNIKVQQESLKELEASLTDIKE